MMVVAHFNMIAELLVGIKVFLAGEAIVMISIFPKVFQQGCIGREIGAIGVMISAPLKVADVVTTGTSYMLILRHVSNKLPIASLTVTMGVVMNDVLQNRGIVFEPALTRSTKLLTGRRSYAVIKVYISMVASQGLRFLLCLHQFVHS